METVSNRGQRRQGAADRIRGPTMDQDAKPEGYLVYVWIREFYPLLRRRFLFRADSTPADLQWVPQIAFGWTAKRRAN